MTKRPFYLMFTIIVISLLSGCSGPSKSTDYHMPESGVWFCEELQVRLVFDEENGIRKASTIIIDGEEIECLCTSELNTTYLFLICQEKDPPISKLYLGSTIYWWTVIDYTEDELTLEDYDTGQVYSFMRVK